MLKRLGIREVAVVPFTASEGVFDSSSILGGNMEA
jgi:hypothetical protein